MRREHFEETKGSSVCGALKARERVKQDEARKAGSHVQVYPENNESPRGVLARSDEVRPPQWCTSVDATVQVRRLAAYTRAIAVGRQTRGSIC